MAGPVPAIHVVEPGGASPALILRSELARVSKEAPERTETSFETPLAAAPQDEVSGNEKRDHRHGSPDHVQRLGAERTTTGGNSEPDRG